MKYPRLKKWLKRIGVILIVLLIGVQFVRPNGNDEPVIAANSLKAKFSVSTETEQILKTSCYDCHSNHSVPMWYMQIQPIGMWIEHHIDEGKEELNFDVFSEYSPKRQFHKLEEIGEVVEESEMPLTSYTLVHGNAKLTEAQKKDLIDWSKAMMDSMRAQYPEDSLKMKH